MKKSDLYGIIGSTIACILLLLLLLFIYMPSRQVPEEEGIIVSFGDSFDGGGEGSYSALDEPLGSENPTPIPSTPTTASNPDPSTQDLITQRDNSVALAQQREDERKRKEQEEAERRRREEQQQEQRRQQEIANNANNTIGNAFGGGGSGQQVGGGGRSEGGGSGDTTGDTQRGNPVGKGLSGGNSWSLEGRSLIGRIPEPTYSQNTEGKISVTIRVDKNGRVETATIDLSGTNISDAQLHKATLDAARKTKFSSGDNVAIGKLTYNFRLN